MDYEQDYSKLTQTDQQWYHSDGICRYTPETATLRDTADTDLRVKESAEVAGMLDNEDFD